MRLLAAPELRLKGGTGVNPPLKAVGELASNLIRGPLKEDVLEVDRTQVKGCTVTTRDTIHRFGGRDKDTAISVERLVGRSGKRSPESPDWPMVRG